MKRMLLVLSACAAMGVMIGSVRVPVVEAQTASRLKNIQVMKGMSDREIQETMQAWAKQLGVKCAGCHVQGDFASDDNALKKTARQMYQMVQALNQQEFFKNSERKADCYICHKGSTEIAPMGN